MAAVNQRPDFSPAQALSASAVSRFKWRRQAEGEIETARVQGCGRPESWHPHSLSAPA
ncbi:hypothetical protein OIU92_01545 [Escherichia coli]|nr:hypothetical protein [Escherichia coli]